MSVVDVEPEHFQQAAGLVCYYNSLKYHYLFVSRDEIAGKHVRAMSTVPDQAQSETSSPPIPIPVGVPIELRAEIDFERLSFAFRLPGGDWQWLDRQFDASSLSDEASTPGAPNFTGAFVGMACQDVAGTGCHADFDWFEYRERPYVIDPRVDGVRRHAR